MTTPVAAAVTVTVPLPPSSVTQSSSRSTNQVTINWTAPRSNGGSEITGYRVQATRALIDYGELNSEPRPTVYFDVDPPHTGTDMTYTHTGLTAGSVYYYQVYAINAIGESAPLPFPFRAVTTPSP